MLRPRYILIGPKKALYFPALMLIGSGVALSNTIAYGEALFKKRSFFGRTPKLGLTGRNGPAKKSGPRYGKNTLGPLLFFEFAMGLYCAYVSYYSFFAKHFILSLFAIIYTCGFLYLSLKAMWEALPNNAGYRS